jgi:hypothetical protein
LAIRRDLVAEEDVKDVVKDVVKTVVEDVVESVYQRPSAELKA